MRPKSLILLALALGCGLVASIGISQVMDRNANNSPVMIETAPVYVALFNINLGDPIDATMVALQEWPKDKIPAGCISELSELEGRRPRSAIIQGEPIMEAKLLAPGQTADPIGEIPEGFRLVTIPVDAEKSAAGLLSPGDRVDIQLFVPKDSRINVEEAMTKVILQNIRVYAVDQTVQRLGDGGDSKAIAKTVSLLLTPAQASRIHLAEKIGEITLVPRNPNDEDMAEWSDITVGDLLTAGEANTREKEQARDAETPPSSAGLLGAVTAIVEEKEINPPWRMEIVEASDVREMLFDAETGKPVVSDPRDSERKATLRELAPSGAKSGRNSSSSRRSTELQLEQLDGEELDVDIDLKDLPVDVDADFPIDFGP